MIMDISFKPPVNARRGAYKFWPSELPDIRPCAEFTLEEAIQLIDNYVLVTNCFSRGLSRLDFPYPHFCSLREVGVDNWPFWKIENERVMLTRYR